MKWVKASVKVLKRPMLTLAAKGLYGVLRSFADSNGKNCFPSIPKLMQVCNCDRKTVFKYLDELEKWCVIRRVRRFDTSNLYQFLDGSILKQPCPANETKEEAQNGSILKKPKEGRPSGRRYTLSRRIPKTSPEVESGLPTAE